MPFAPRSRRSRWLRLVLAVLALVASHVSIARTALGAPCARVAGAGVAHVDGATASHLAAPVATEGEAPHDDAPASPALVSACTTAVASLPPLTALPAALITSRAATLPPGPDARPASHAPPPPFHPPRANRVRRGS